MEGLIRIQILNFYGKNDGSRSLEAHKHRNKANLHLYDRKEVSYQGPGKLFFYAVV
jgi:hypothetical protein